MAEITGCDEGPDPIASSPQPPQFKLDPRLARLLGIHTQTRSCIIQALWQYIKTNKLQDSHDKEYINCDKYFQQVRRDTSHLQQPENLQVHSRHLTALDL